MSRQRLGIAGILLLMIAIAVWVALPKHGIFGGQGLHC
jgi:hypothetical protein